MKTSSKFLVGVFAGLIAGVAALALAANTGSNFYFGFNPLTNYNGTPGVPYAGGPVPTLSGAGCGTLATVQASEVGGSGVFQFTPNLATCVITATVPLGQGATAAVAANNGIYCVAVDETTGTATVKQTAHTTSSCTLTFTGATTSDLVLVEIQAY